MTEDELRYMENVAEAKRQEAERERERNAERAAQERAEQEAARARENRRRTPEEEADDRAEAQAREAEWERRDAEWEPIRRIVQPLFIAAVIIGFFTFAGWMYLKGLPRGERNGEPTYKTADEVKRGYVTYGEKVYSLSSKNEGSFVSEENNRRLSYNLKTDRGWVEATFHNDKGKGFDVNQITVNVKGGAAQKAQWHATAPGKDAKAPGKGGNTRTAEQVRNGYITLDGEVYSLKTDAAVVATDDEILFFKLKEEPDVRIKFYDKSGNAEYQVTNLKVPEGYKTLTWHETDPRKKK